MLSLQNLVQSSVDYAGLFPPAALSLEVVANNYAKYLTAPSSSMLGRLVIPTSRLDELESTAMSLVEPGPWRISALVPPWTADDELFSKACQSINAFNERQDRFKVDSIETKVRSVESVAPIIDGIPESVNAFLEVAFGESQAAVLAEIATKKAASANDQSDIFAKARTGSVVAEEIPSIAHVASFIGECSRHRLGFKATAGLHHPIRAEYRLTYAENPPCGIMHGFVNVFVAAVVAFEYQVANDVVEQVLAETSLDSFVVDDENLAWREFEITASRIAHWRENGILSFGSCSFDEPTTELAAHFKK